ncbi:MAG: (2Fe-2S)-binding protein [Anaerolineales bacterium]
MKQLISLIVNGQVREVWTSVHKTLLEVLREDLNLAGTKHGCELGECGACSVLIDGRPVLSCLVLPIEVQGSDILTIEGVADDRHAHPLQTAFSELGAAQCGYCTPGMIVTSKALLDSDPRPDESMIREALAGNLCRCTGYSKIVEAVEMASERMQPQAENHDRSRQSGG